MLGSYVAGRSPLHRAPAGLKLAVLAMGLLALAVARRPAAVAVAAVLVGALVMVSGVGWRAFAAQLRPVLGMAVLIGAVQVWLSGPRAAVVVVGMLLVAVAAAGVVTLTTRSQDLLDALVAALRPLRVLGVDPDRVGLVLALAVRSVPVLADLAHEVVQARRARGAERSVRAFAVPFVVRALRHADRLGEALAARGVDD